MRPADAPPPYDTVVFDCDSTLSFIEGIDELAGSKKAAIEALTARAMAGDVPLEDVYGERLALLEPTRSNLERVAKLYAEKALPHARELVSALRSLGKRVYVLSGGLLPAVRPFALGLGFDEADIYAVDIHFDDQGHYAGYEEDSPLARNGGKPEIVASFPGEAKALVGDGASDLEAAEFLSRFVAFGGVVRREKVFSASRVTCDAPDLAALCPHLFSEHEMETLRSAPQHAALIEAAASFSAR